MNMRRAINRIQVNLRYHLEKTVPAKEIRALLEQGIPERQVSDMLKKKHSENEPKKISKPFESIDYERLFEQLTVEHNELEIKYMARGEAYRVLLDKYQNALNHIESLEQKLTKQLDTKPVLSDMMK